MDHQETIAQHQQLLNSWRKILKICLDLQLELGEAEAPAGIAVGIVEARSEIERLKGLLRGWGENVVDLPEEMTVANPEMITSHLRRLEIYRRNLAHILEQRAMYAEREIPTFLVNQILETRRNIRSIKSLLQGWNATVGDHPDDEE